MYSPSINNLISQFKRLPSVGQRSAERFVFCLLKSGKKDVNELREALNSLLTNTKSCEICWNFDDKSPCHICRDLKRDPAVVCVTADPQDIPVIEKTGEFRGTYHVLRGLFEMGDEMSSLKKIKLRELLTRLKTGKVKEIILALNPDMPGETTMLFLEREIKKHFSTIKITRLARGLPMGSDIQYADEITLGSAFKNRIRK
ncbi:recombination mediator RecR [Patescibacteria group bacterium]|nr:recombination mediator RecR [Patescibacteria group bacterium]MBU1613123.1 recombination mediator RecR [Patescibacteria group bacterium]